MQFVRSKIKAGSTTVNLIIEQNRIAEKCIFKV